MEGQLQRGNRDSKASFFERKPWWRALYYVYFVGVVVGVVLLYSAHRQTSQNSTSTPATATGQATLAQPTAKASTAPIATTTPSTPSKSSAVSGATPAPSSASGESSGFEKFADLMSPSEEMVEKGKALYLNDCVACHGANGEGDGPAAAALKPKPRDFHSAKGWINGRMVSEMFKTLTNGIPGSPMPPFSTISVNDRLDIISYIRSFKGFPKETKADVEALAKMVSKAGGVDQGSD